VERKCSLLHIFRTFFRHTQFPLQCHLSFSGQTGFHGLGWGQIYFLTFIILISFSHLRLVLLRTRSLLSCVFWLNFCCAFFISPVGAVLYVLLIFRDRRLTFVKCGFMFSSTFHILRSAFFFLQ